MASVKPGVIALFDVDGTLTEPRKSQVPRIRCGSAPVSFWRTKVGVTTRIYGIGEAWSNCIVRCGWDSHISRKVVTQKMLQFMKDLGNVVKIGVVGGSDLIKISQQLGQTDNL